MRFPSLVIGQSGKQYLIVADNCMDAFATPASWRRRQKPVLRRAGLVSSLLSVAQWYNVYRRLCCHKLNMLLQWQGRLFRDPRGSIDRPEVSPYHAALQPFSVTEVGAKLMRVYTVTQ